MTTPLVLKIAIGLTIVLQLAAIVYALRLVKRTKYNAIWILCIIGFVLIAAERYFELRFLNGEGVSQLVSIFLGVGVSICISIAVMFAHRLVGYLDRVARQRALFNKRILTAVLRAEEKSKLNFSKELHDGLGPLLSSAKMSLSALKHENLSEEQSEMIGNTEYVIEEAIRSVREISNNLSPQVLLDFGLSHAVRNFVSRSSALHGVSIRFNTPLRAERFDKDVEIIIYRVICELINNSLKHSGCTMIVISLALEQNSLILTYSDNGRGFNPQAVLDCGMGLSNITSRIGSLGGNIDITSSIGKGMKARAEVKIQGSER